MERQWTEQDFLSCSGSTRFGREMAAAAPFPDLAAAVESARDIYFNRVDVKGWLESFAAHPAIGSKSKSISQWSKEEQSAAVATATDSSMQELVEWNDRYKEKFGTVFLICASGRSTSEILDELKRRYTNRPIVELEIAAQEDMKIIELRLARLFEGEARASPSVTTQLPISQPNKPAVMASGSQSFAKGKGSATEFVKATWDSQTTSIFVQLCVEQVRAGNKPHTHFNKIGWEHILKGFKEKTGRSYTRLQLKNKWDNLKKEWQLWDSFRRGETRLGWDYAKGTISAPDSWWELKIQKYPDAAKFREKGLPHEHELYICFADAAAIGEYALTPASGVLPPFIQSDEDREQSCEDVADSSPPICTTPDVDVTGGEGAVGVGGGVGGGGEVGGGGVGGGGVGGRGGVGDPSRRRPSDGGSVTTKKKKKNEVGGAAMLYQALEDITGVLRSQNTDNDPPGRSIDDCVAVLGRLPGVTVGDPLYMYGTLMLSNPTHRSMFMALPNDEVRRSYIELAQQRESQLPPPR